MKKLLPWSGLPPVRIPKACRDSQDRALDKLIVQALGWRKGDGASFGAVRIDADKMFLSEVGATGTVCVRGLRSHLDWLWTRLPATESRLKRFFIRLGRALASTKKRKELPDWLRGVNQTERFIIEGWCESIIVDGEWWPPLCCLTYPAIRKFLKLCKRPLAITDSNDTFRQRIERLGLVGIPKGKIKHVEKRHGQFIFA